MIPRIIHQTAPSKTLTWEEARLAQRLRRVLRGWKYRMWDDADNQRLVETKFPHFADTFSSISRGVVKADIARYMLLHIHGGFYFDTDYKLLNSIGDDILSHACVLPISRQSEGENGFRVGNAILGSKPGHAFWLDFIDHLFSNASLASTPENRVESTTGPDGLTEFYVERQSRYPDIHLPARSLFHPRKTHYGLSFARSRNTYGVHLCYGSWRSQRLPKKLKNFIVRKVTALV